MHEIGRVKRECKEKKIRRDEHQAEADEQYRVKIERDELPIG